MGRGCRPPPPDWPTMSPVGFGREVDTTIVVGVDWILTSETDEPAVLILGV